MVDAETDFGTARGLRTRDGLALWRGVPYARVTARFARPEPPAAWQGVKECVRYGRQAVQPVLSVSDGLNRFLWRGDGPTRAPAALPRSMSEQCCSLNILSPPGGRLPVIVWIHGGAFLHGSGADGVYRGSALAHAGVVLVTINYRLGCFGFLKVPGGDPNCGLWDQLMAVRWVHSQIVHFGGDPDRITIAGESAGGMSCGSLLCSPLSQPYFHRAILMSGACSNVMSAEDAAEVADQFAEVEIGGRPVGLELETLRAIPAHRLLAAQQMFGWRCGPMPWQPCVDGELILSQPLDPTNIAGLSLQGLQGKQVMLGSTADEWQLFSPPISPSWLPFRPGSTTLRAATVRAAKRQASGVGQLAPDAEPVPVSADLSRELLKTLRSEQRLQDWDGSMRAFMTLMAFTGPARLAARVLADAGVTVYVYHYELDAGILGACHAAELPLMFGSFNKHWTLRLLTGHYKQPAAVSAVSASMVGAFTAFARTGSPKLGEPAWEMPYSREQPYFLGWGRPTAKLVKESAEDDTALNRGVAILESQRRPFGLKLGRGVIIDKTSQQMQSKM